MNTQNLFLFGDQTCDTLASIRNLFLCSKRIPSLQAFLREATDFIQNESSKLEVAERQSFISFNTLLDLAEDYAKRELPDDLLTTVLSYVSRIGELIIYVEDDPTLFGTTTSPTHVLGLCTGLLPAAVLAGARSIHELHKLALKALGVLFRLAVEVSRRSRLIEKGPGCWAFVISGVSAAEQQNIIDEFHRVQEVPQHRHAYISVVSQAWATVCGPPSILNKLFAHSPVLQLAPKLRLLVGTAVHAPHLPQPDIDKMIGSDPTFDMPLTSKTQIMSTSTCQLYDASTLRMLLYQMVEDIAQNTLHLTSTIQAVAARVPTGDQVVKLRLVGPTSHASLVVRALESQNIKMTMVEKAEISNTDTGLRDGSGYVAIVGLSGRFPGAENLRQFWEILQNGRELYKPIPKSRFDLEAYFDASGKAKNAISSRHGCFLDNPGHFDVRLFNVSPREAMQMDPMQRLLLMSSYEALEMAGYNRDATISTDSKRIATYFGQAADDQKDINHSEGIDMYYVPGLARAFAPGRLNHFYKWEGASYSLDSACGSSSSAVLMACSDLLVRNCDTALAGGGSVLNSPQPYSGLSKGGFLSTTGGCKTFLEDADGYCRGEGVGVVVLKRLEDAIADNDNVYAVIRSMAKNYSAHATSITHPHAETQQRLYRQVLQKAGVHPHEVSYVEMHGTATQAGDVCEMSSVTNVFAKDRLKDNPLYLGAVKANIGHGEAAAGVTALIKTVMMLKQNVIPPQPGILSPLNRKFPPLDMLNVHIPSRKINFEEATTRHRKRKVILNNFDAAGGNTSFLIEEAPQRKVKEADPRTFHVVVCSAQTLSSFRANKRRLLQHLALDSQINLADLAYTTTARRMHHVFRSAYSVSCVDELNRLLKSDLAIAESPKRTDTKVPIVFTFTGQGSQYMGMGQDLFQVYPRFRDRLMELQSWCDWLGFPTFLDMFVTSDTTLGSKSPVQVQLAIVCLEIALADLWKSWGVEPDIVIGHSLGEYAALCVAGVLSVADTLFLVAKRATLLSDKCTPGTYAMLAVASAAVSLRETLDSKNFPECEISCKNSPNSTVVSGPINTLKRLQAHLESTGAKTTFLDVPFGFHSAQLEPLLSEMKVIAQKIHFAKPVVPVASTLKGVIVTDTGVFNAEYLIRQAREPVNFIGAVHACREAGFACDETLWLELGPNPVCSSLLRSNLEIQSEKLLLTLESGGDSWNLVSRSMAVIYTSGRNINWPDYHKDYLHCLTLLELPTYAFDVKDYWTPYKEPSQIADTRDTLAPVQVSVPGFPTSTLQAVEIESISESKICVIFTSRTAEPNLHEAIRGHIVCGTPICPSSVFVDMAFAAASYVQVRGKRGWQLRGMSLEALSIIHPLVVSHINPKQSIRITATSSASSKWTVKIIFQSTDGSSTQDHGTCRVVYGNPDEWKAEWARHAWLVKARSDAIIRSSHNREVHRLLGPIVYKLFEHVVHYSNRYQGLDEVFLDNIAGDTVAKIKLKSIQGAGTFTLNPYWTDSIVHLSGFVLNGNSTTPGDMVYISGGLESMRIAEELSEDKSYTCYVRMEAAKTRGYLTGDVYVLDGDTVIALCAGVTFQELKKSVLCAIIGNHSISSALKQHEPLYHDAQGASNAKTQLASTNDSTSSSGSWSKDPVYTPLADSEDESDMAEIFITAFLAETGIDPQEIEPSSLFSNMGVDSMMTIAIIDSVKKHTGVMLPANFLVSHPTVASVRKALEKTIDRESDSADAELARHPSGTEEPVSEPDPLDKPLIKAQKVTKDYTEYSSKVVLLQGSTSSDLTPLFLLTDGAGSATAYIHLPAFPRGRPIYALESPFLHCPSEYTCTIQQIAHIFKAAIQKTQPQGPYMIGGWSAGAVYAYEVTRQVLSEGGEILGLIVLDMRIPRPMPDGIEPNMDLLEQAGLVTGINRAGRTASHISDKLKQHLLSTVKALAVYDPIPMEAPRQPALTVIVWAKIGMNEVIGKTDCEEPDPNKNIMEDEETGLKAWFFAKRRHFGANGWDKLVGEVECHAIDADHFSMVAPPMVKVTGTIMAEAVERFAANTTPVDS